MDMQKHNDWPSIQTQPVPRFQLVHKGLHTHMRLYARIKNTYTQSPSVTSVTSALGLEEMLGGQMMQ